MYLCESVEGDINDGARLSDNVAQNRQRRSKAVHLHLDRDHLILVVWSLLVQGQDELSGLHPFFLLA